MSNYASLQGKVLVATYGTNVFREVGNAPDFSLSPTSKDIKHHESWTGARSIDKVVTTETEHKVAATLEDFSKDNLALALWGTAITKTLGTVATPAPDVSDASLTVGSIWGLSYGKVSAVVVKDSADVTVDAEDYEVNAKYGSIKILNLPTGLDAYALPLKATYSYGATDVVSLLNAPAQEIAVRFEGINTVNNQAMLAVLYRVRLDVTKKLDLIGNDIMKFVLDGTCLVDATKPVDSELGQFGYIAYL